MIGDTLTSFFVIASLFSLVIASLFLLSLRAQRGNPGGASDCFGTNVPRNDRGNVSLRASSLLSLRAQRSNPGGASDCFAEVRHGMHQHHTYFRATKAFQAI